MTTPDVDDPRFATTDPKTTLVRKLNEPASKSKKWKAGMIGLSCIVVIWIGTFIAVFLRPESAQSFTNLALPVITAIGAIISILITGQSAVDWHTTTSLSMFDNPKKPTPTPTQ